MYLRGLDATPIVFDRRKWAGSSIRVEEGRLHLSIGQPSRNGLYEPFYEHDACGVGFVANLSGEATHTIIRQGVQVLENL